MENAPLKFKYLSHVSSRENFNFMMSFSLRVPYDRELSMPAPAFKSKAFCKSKLSARLAKTLC